MQASKIIYYVSTGLVVAMMSFSAYSYLTNPSMKVAFIHLGFPSYFRLELAIAKIAGVLVLLIPAPARVKEWAYAGFAITFVSAIIAHVASNDPVANRVMPGVAFLLLIASYICYHQKAILNAAPDSANTVVA